MRSWLLYRLYIVDETALSSKTLSAVSPWTEEDNFDYKNFCVTRYPLRHLCSIQIRLLQCTLTCSSQTTFYRQRVWYSAARLIFKLHHRRCCIAFMMRLHRMPVSERIEYKISCICFNMITGAVPRHFVCLVSGINWNSLSYNIWHSSSYLGLLSICLKYSTTCKCSSAWLASLPGDMFVAFCE